LWSPSPAPARCGCGPRARAQSHRDHASLRPFPVRPALPTGLGFEAAGTIEALGAGVAGFSPGDRVALVPAYSAGQYALYGRSRSRRAAPWWRSPTAWVSTKPQQPGRLIARPGRPGRNRRFKGRADRPHSGSIERCRPRRDPDCQSSRRASDRADPHRGESDGATPTGASAVIATSEQDVVAEVKGLTGGKGAELVFDPVGGPEFAELARSSAAGGTLVLYGALDTRPTIVPPFDIFARDLTVRGLALTPSPATTRSSPH